MNAFAQAVGGKAHHVALHKPRLPPGAWQLFWFGRLTSDPASQRTPFIRAYLVQVELSGSKILRRHSQVIHVDLPITELPALPLGTVYADTVIHSGLPLSDGARWADITVDFKRESIHVFPRLATEDDGVSFLRPSPRVPPDDTEYEGLLLAVSGSDQRNTYLFPCTTIFQFFWARSSKWAQLMVDGRFVDYNHYIFDARRSRINEDRTEAMIWLRQWMPDEDAPFIATLAFDQYALDVGSNIYRHLAQPLRDSQARCIRALPPYQGHIPLRVLMHPVPTRHGQAMLVQSISQCDYAPAIRKLTFDRDNDGRTTAELATGTEKRPLDRPSFGPVQSLLQDSTELSSESPSNSSIPIEIIAQSMSNRFPRMIEMETEKLPQEQTQYENEQEQAQCLLSRWEDRVSTLEGARSSAQLAPAALIRGEEFSDGIEASDPLPVRGDIANLANVLLTGDSFEFKVKDEIWTATPHLVNMPGQEGNYFRVPSSVNGLALAWLYRDPGNMFRKRALCIRVTFRKSSSACAWTRYLLDFEPREIPSAPVQTRVLFFWNETNTPLLDEVASIRSLVRAIALKGNANISALEMGGLLGYPRNHPPEHAITNRFLSSLLSAENSMR